MRTTKMLTNPSLSVLLERKQFKVSWTSEPYTFARTLKRIEYSLESEFTSGALLVRVVAIDTYGKKYVWHENWKEVATVRS